MKSNVKIALVHDFLLKLGGAEKVLAALCKIYPNAPVYTLLYDEAGTRGIFKNQKIFISSLQKKPSFIKKNMGLMLAQFPQAIEEFNFDEYDIVISNSNSFAHGIITKPSTFHLTYCHSPARYMWDWCHEYLAEHNLGFGLKGLLARKMLHEVRIWDKLASIRTDSWAANSRNVQRRIAKYYRVNSSILHPPVEVENIPLCDFLPDDYYVIVSRLEPYKKINLAVLAFKKIKKPLVIIGEGSQKNYLQKLAFASKNIEFLGWQSDSSVREYLKNAKALIFPGEEDFGITPIESMACGRPVIAYNKGGVTETVIDKKTGLFFNEQSSDSLIAAIEKLEKDYLDFAPSECRKQAEKFSQKIFQSNLENLLEEGLTEYKKTMNYE